MEQLGVYKAITAVATELAKSGISKDKKNAQQGYQFRGIDDVYNELAPLLAKNALCILPRVVSRECTERISAKGGALFYVTVEAEFDFVSADDGSKHTVKTFGEAMDSADKATNKAMSAAYKYAAFQAFCIPTEGDNDADATTHEVKAETKEKTSTRKHTGLSPLDAIKKELTDHCKGDVGEMALLLAEATKTVKDGEEKWVKLEELDTLPTNWHGPILNKVRKYIEKEKASA